MLRIWFKKKIFFGTECGIGKEEMKIYVSKGNSSSLKT